MSTQNLEKRKENLLFTLSTELGGSEMDIVNELLEVVRKLESKKQKPINNHAYSLSLVNKVSDYLLNFNDVIKECSSSDKQAIAMAIAISIIKAINNND